MKLGEPAPGAESHSPAAGPVWPERDANEYYRTGYGTIRTDYGVVSVYPVGVLEALRTYRRRAEWCRDTGAPARIAREPLWRTLRYLGYQLRRRNWRAVRMSFNGWLAEPVWEEGPRWRRAGSGWTPNRALVSLEHIIWESNWTDR